MKTLTVTAISAILATALILPAINSAAAETVEDGRKQLSPKAFGEKTKLYKCNEGRCFSLDSNHKGTFGDVKKEDLKSYKKAIELHNALKFMKNYYKIGF